MSAGCIDEYVYNVSQPLVVCLAVFVIFFCSIFVQRWSVNVLFPKLYEVAFRLGSVLFCYCTNGRAVWICYRSSLYCSALMLQFQLLPQLNNICPIILCCYSLAQKANYSTLACVLLTSNYGLFVLSTFKSSAAAQRSLEVETYWASLRLQSPELNNLLFFKYEIQDVVWLPKSDHVTTQL